MKSKVLIPLTIFVFVFLRLSAQSNKDSKTGEQRPGVKCMENSPERHGEEGCTILANKPLLGSPQANVYWHIDRFESREAAVKAAGINGVAAEAHGFFWLMTIEPKAEEHYGGVHDAWIGPIVLPTLNNNSMRVLSSLLMPGSVTPVHTHSGPEVFYIIEGEQCIETPEEGHHLRAGKTFIVPGGGIHRGRVIGSVPRRALALNVYDTALPPSHDLASPPALISCK